MANLLIILNIKGDNMNTIKTCLSEDGYPLYEVNIDGKYQALANKDNYRQDIEDLLNDIEEIFFDAIIFIFGIDSGSYIEEIKKNICEKNKVIIIEPNLEIYKKHKNKIKTENIQLILYDDEMILKKIEEVINYKNVNRIIFHCFGNYQNIYYSEYYKINDILTDKYYKELSTIDVFKRLRKMFFENLLLNLNQIEKSTPLNNYVNINENKPAIIVSAGPSLDKNIQTLLQHKNELDSFFIIAGNRTLPALIKNNIVPNLVVTLDSDPKIYDMMESYLDLDIPLAFYEHSNSTLVNQYKGEKIYVAEILPKAIKELSGYLGSYIGGSVAHCCMDIARIMGCNPIILAGQDCALTYDKIYSDNAHLGIISDMAGRDKIIDIDIYGNDIVTTCTLNFFKLRIEEFIRIIKESQDIEFINVSYGANIIGAPHKELDDIINSINAVDKVNKLKSNKCIKINANNIIDKIFQHIIYFIKKSDECINICNELIKEKDLPSLIDIDENDKKLENFIWVMNTVDEFENNKMNVYISSYFTKFLFEVRQKHFEMLSSDYQNLTSDFRYQSKTFLNYFTDLKDMMQEVECIFISTVAKLK